VKTQADTRTGATPEMGSPRESGHLEAATRSSRPSGRTLVGVGGGGGGGVGGGGGGWGGGCGGGGGVCTRLT